MIPGTLKKLLSSPQDGCSVLDRSLPNRRGPLQHFGTSIPRPDGKSLPPENKIAPALIKHSFRPEHVTVLSARAIPIEAAVEAGLRSVTPEEAEPHLGFKPSVGGLLIPYPRVERPYARLRLDSGELRYLAPKGEDIPVYIGGSDALAASKTLYVVEGPLKALALSAAGLPAVGLGGVWTTLVTENGHEFLNESWQILSLQGRKVVVVFDAGRANNPRVALAEARLGLALEKAGADVYVTSLPLDGGRDQGPDDLLAAQGRDALQKVLARQVPADPVRLVQALVDDDDEPVETQLRLAKLLGDLPFLASIRMRGEPTAFAVKTLLKDNGIPKQDVKEALESYATKLLDERPEADRRPPEDTPKFAVHEGKLCRQTMGRGEDGAWEPLFDPICNFTAEIVREELRDDGITSETCLVLSGKLSSSDQMLPEISLEPANFEKTTWPMECWGSKVIVDPATSGPTLRAAIQTVSNAKGGRVYTHTGWRKLEGQWVFLHGGGALGVDDVRVALSGAAASYVLPSAIVDPKEAIQGILDMLEVAEPTITYPLLCAMFRAPLQSSLMCDAVVWPYGQTGSHKSTMTALFMSTFGIQERLGLTVNWSSTLASLENDTFLAQDLPVVIDDYAPSGTGSDDDVRKKAIKFVRSIGNGVARGRMNSDLTARADRRPRALVISTGEDLPQHPSIVARLVPIPMKPGQVDLKRLTTAQKRVGRAPHAMAAYLHWLRPQMDGMSTQMAGRFADFRADFQSGSLHARSPEGLAHLALGGEAFTSFARDLGALTKPEARRVLDGVMQALHALAGDQKMTVADSDVCNRFLRSLNALLIQGKAWLKHLGKASVDIRYESDFIGWQDDSHVFLQPEATFVAVDRSLRSIGRGIEIGDSRLWRQMLDRGLIAEHDKNRYTCRRVLDGNSKTVIVMDLRHLDRDGDGGGGDGGSRPQVTTPCDPVGNIVLNPKNLVQTSPNSVQTDASLVQNSKAEPRHIQEIQGLSNRDLRICTNCTRNRRVYGDGHAIFEEEVLSSEAAPSSGTYSEMCADCAEDLSCGRFSPSGAAPVFQHITSPADLAQVAVAVEKAGVVAIDLVTMSSSDIVDKPQFLRLATADGTVFDIDLLATQGLGPAKAALSKVEVVGHGLQATVKVLKYHFGVLPKGSWDSMTASRLLDGSEHKKETGFHGFDAVLNRYLPRQPTTGTPSLGILFKLRERLEQELRERGLWEVYVLECALIPSVVDIELAGVRVNRALWANLVGECRRELQELEGRLKPALGVDTLRNQEAKLTGLASLGIRVKKTGRGELAPYASHPVVQDLLRHQNREAFLLDLGPKILQALDESPDERVRANLDPMGASTGRWTCSEPHLQNVPKRDGSRAAIVPADGYSFIVADYAAIELRVLAHVTQDPVLMNVFKAGGDPHRMMASLMVGKPPEAVTPDERQRAKAVNFGFAFGMGSQKFVTNALKDYGLVLTRDEADAFKATYLKTYKGIAEWQQQMKEDMRREVRSASGRMRRFPPGNDHYTDRLNMAIQGTAADGLKAAVVDLQFWLDALGAKIVLAIHDELLVEVPQQVAEEAKAIIVHCMKAGMARYVTSVPIVVEAEIRERWAT